MTKDEIIKLAREAGIDVSLYDMGAASCVFSEGCHGVARDEFQRFARACYEAGRTAEREECAKLCDEMRDHWSDYKDTALLNGDVALSNAASGEPRAAEFLAKAIRARGKP